ncbi:MAG: PhzF family phenazine biosynthesis protein [Sphingomonadales bacterium]|nr:MAG: PhzF family phenazine biosynthesis protein [Sphingomonadales bacterium]
MRLPIYRIDAFSDQPFRGNPAAVMPLEHWLDDSLLQAIAAENNLAETAYFVADPSGAADYELRWFTPAVEVALCGHATLAAAHVLWRHLGFTGTVIAFRTRQSGVLRVSRNADGRLTLDFPSYRLAPVEEPALVAALGGAPDAVLGGGIWRMAVYGCQADVTALTPDLRAIKGMGHMVIATAAGETADFVSRFFAPAHGVDEDSVTGSAHCRLIPYWSERLGKAELYAEQISQRLGRLWCRDRGERVDIAGYCIDTLIGEVLA